MLRFGGDKYGRIQSEVTGERGEEEMEHSIARERLNARAKSRSEKTDETRHRILEESIKLFVEQGYEKTTTRQIVQKAGILNGSLYNIYKSKDEIFMDIAKITFKEAASLMDEVLGPNPSERQILCFPTCIQIYASFRSPRIAELLSVAHTKWDMFQYAISFYKDWMTDHSGSWEGLIDEPGFDLKLIAFSGSLGSVLKTIAEGAAPMSEMDCMRIMCSLELRTFGLDDDCPEESIRKIISGLESSVIEICNMKI